MSATGELRCGSCGEFTPAGRFCIHCGASTQQTCPSCGAAIVPGARFCLECGVSLTEAAPPGRASVPGAFAERRLVSVLFADLVGFTTLSEHRDPEEVRELLSRYFDRCRSLIERYGGTVEKFIGDAVMAVWGTPVAREDDAERAVRAALALTQAVSLLGDEIAMPELRVRAGVLTGKAAVELGAEGEGMVLGDTVNTASRLHRGELARAQELLEPLNADTGWAETTVMAKAARALIMRAAGNAQDALPQAREAALAVVDRGQSHAPIEFTEAVECAFDTGELAVVRELLARVDALKPVQLIPLLDAEAMRARARLALRDRNFDAAQRWFRRSIDLFRELATPFNLARAQLEYAELLGDVDEAKAPRAEAAAVFQGLRATPWLERARAHVDEVLA